MLNHFLFDLLRWTSELNPWSAPARQGRGTPETDNSMRGHKEAQSRATKRLKVKVDSSFALFVLLCGSGLCFLWLVVLDTVSASAL